MLEPNQDIPTENLGMICTCGDDEQAAADVLRATVRALLEAGTPELRPRTITDLDFVDELTYSLTHDLRCGTIEISTDMWHAVRVEYLDPDNLDRRLIAICDHVLDGLCLVWKELATRAGIWKDTP